MSPAERQARLAKELLRFEDPQERLSYIVDRAKKSPRLPAELKTDACRIQGCVTKIWLRSSIENGRCIFIVDSESSMVRGLAVLIAETYSECPPQEVAQFHSTIFEASKLERMITPTRQHGLAQLQGAIRIFAQNLPPVHEPL